MKTIKIKLNLKPVWKLSKGHASHRSGSGCHDSRSKRQRTRAAVQQKKISEYE